MFCRIACHKDMYQFITNRILHSIVSISSIYQVNLPSNTNMCFFYFKLFSQFKPPNLSCMQLYPSVTLSNALFVKQFLIKKA